MFYRVKVLRSYLKLMEWYGAYRHSLSSITSLVPFDFVHFLCTDRTYAPPYSLPILGMHEVISLHVGQGGIQIGNACCKHILLLLQERYTATRVWFVVVRRG